MKVHLLCGSLALAPHLIDVIEETRGARVTGHTTVPAEALRAIAQSRPDVVVVEVQGPASPGLKVLRALRGTPERPYLIVLADDASPEARDVYASAGADYAFDRFRHLYSLSQTLEILALGLKAARRSARHTTSSGSGPHVAH